VFDYRGAALRQQRMAQQRSGGAITFTQPAPIGGWNTRDDAGNMPPEDAELLVNWIPEANFLRQRKGSEHLLKLTELVSGDIVVTATKPPLSIIEFKNESVTRALYCTQSSISVRSSSSIATRLSSSFTNGFWSGINFNNVMGLFNGYDQPQLYDGGLDTSALTNLSITGPADPSRLIEAHVHRGRVFYVERDVCGFWYGAADTLGAALTFFPLSRVARQGGSLLTIKSWTVDGGEGPDDYAVFIMDSGEIIVYQGNDPGRSAAWGLVGRYTIPKPIHRRACVQVGAQIVVATDYDYMMLPEAFKPNIKPTKLSGALKEAASKYRDLQGWQGVYYQSGPWLLFNVPTGAGTSEQHVINLKGAATKFTGWNTMTFGVIDGVLHYGGLPQPAPGRIFVADTGLLDAFDASTDSSITSQAWQAPSNLGQSLPKSVVDYRPRLQSEGDLTIESGLAYDFGPNDFNQSMTLSADGTPWNTSDWETSEWSVESFNKQEWLTGGGDGTYVQLRMTTTAPRQTLKWFKTDYRYKLTGPLE
jgi:hypothetical protein